MLTLSENPLAICVADEPARRRVAQVSAVMRCPALAVSREEATASRPALFDAGLLVYDLHPWDQTAIGWIRELHHQLPALPILLYAPVRPGVGDLLVQAGAHPNVTGMLQLDGRDELVRLRSALRKAMDMSPLIRLTCLIHELFPDLPRRTEEFVRRGLRMIFAAAHPMPTVKSLAQRLGVTVRTLERGWPTALLPPPGAFLDLLVLISFLFVAEKTGMPTTAVARVYGLPARRLRRLRDRFLSWDAQSSGHEDAASGLTLALASLAGRLQDPPHRATGAVSGYPTRLAGNDRPGS